MKKSLFIISAALLTLASCDEEAVVNISLVPQANKVLTASFEQDGSATRMNIASNNGLTWTEGDAIAVFGEDETTAVGYTLSEGEGEASGTFTTTGTAPGTIVGVAFPYSENATLTEEGILGMDLSSALVQTTEGACNLPMWGTVTEGNIEFKHLAGLLKVNLTDIPAGYNKLTVTASNPIAGAFTVNTGNETPVLTAADGNENSTVTVSFTAATAEAKDQVLYLPLPVGTYESIVVSISNGTDTKVLKQWAGIAVERAKVYKTSADCDTYVTTAEDLKTAIAAAEAGDTINLGADITMSEILVINKAITLNGNGHTLTSSAGRAINVSGAEANGVTIQNLIIECSGERGINIIQNATNVTIKNVTATADNYTVCVAGSAPNAVVTITGSTLTGKNVVNVAAVEANVTVSNSTLNCEDDNANAGNNFAALCLNKDATDGTITATGTTITVTDGSDSVPARNDAEGGTITIDGSAEGVVQSVAVIEHDDYYADYTTLQAAIEAATSGQTIKLIRDITLTSKIIANKAITLDLNGKTLTENGQSSEANDFRMTFNGDFTIKNGTIITTSRFPIVIDNANRITGAFVDVDIEGERSGEIPNSVNGTVILIGAANVTFDSECTINATGYTCAIEGSSNDAMTSSANITINGASITLVNGSTYAHETVLGAGYGSTINVTGGTIDGSQAENAVMTYPTGGTINISGGTVKGNLNRMDPNEGKTTAIVITGGLFTEDPSDFIDSSRYNSYKYDDEEYYIVEEDTFIPV